MNPTPQTFPEVLKNFLFSMASRKFLLAIIGAIIGYFGPKYGLTNEQIAFVLAPLGTFILGEAYNDGKRNEKATPTTVNAGGDVNLDNATPATKPVKQKLKEFAVEEIQEELRERGYGLAAGGVGVLLGGNSLPPVQSNNYTDAAQYIETLPNDEAENYQIEETIFDDEAVTSDANNQA